MSTIVLFLFCFLHFLLKAFFFVIRFPSGDKITSIFLVQLLAHLPPSQVISLLDSDNFQPIFNCFSKDQNFIILKVHNNYFMPNVGFLPKYAVIYCYAKYIVISFVSIEEQKIGTHERVNISIFNRKFIYSYFIQSVIFHTLCTLIPMLRK